MLGHLPPQPQPAPDPHHAEDEEDDPNLPELLVWNEDAGEYQSPRYGDDDEEDDKEGGDGGGDIPAMRSSTWGNRGVPATRYDDMFELAAEVRSPPNVAMALEGSRGAEWAAAMEAEQESLWENGVYEEVQRPAGKKVIGTKWVLRVKPDVEGNFDKFKARVVAKGFRQVEGVGYDETFAPTVRFESVRALIAMAASLG